jgi:RimJ/RimL family protein N-acetyltransferase
MRLEDAPNILQLNADEEVLRYVHDEPFRDEKAALDWIRSIDAELPAGIGRWSVTLHDGTWVGRCSLRRQPDGDVLMGYRLLRSQWGKGLASETVSALLSAAFGVHKLPFVLSYIASANMASRRVAEKNGGYLWKENNGGLAVHALVYRFDAPILS